MIFFFKNPVIIVINAPEPVALPKANFMETKSNS